ncbi:hypothetical protein ABLE91_21910 [Aquabacter sp. CN5-332]|uniref:hypothetical protein n=1 Tax=Aquabacter sp. CN5-332 TaxID=3156608 RepID=UPI0032B50CB4
MRRRVVVILSLLLLASAAEAAPPKCLQSTRFQVVHMPRTGSPGSHIVVQPLRPGQNRPCMFRRWVGDFSVGGPEDTFYVLGLSGDVLVLDEGTGPARMLAFYNLATRRTSFTRSYDDEVPVKVEAGKVTFWAVTGPGEPATCRQFKDYAAKGLGAALAQQAVITLPDGQEELSGPVRCIARQ